jgi:hypothetical protein
MTAFAASQALVVVRHFAVWAKHSPAERDA